MSKHFNITGLCNPDMHWMADTSGKIAKIMDMVAAGNYFLINRPRQYGKTTALFLLEKELLKTGKYLPIKISFEGIDSPTYQDHQQFINTFLGMIKGELKNLGKHELVTMIQQYSRSIGNFFQMDELLDKLNTIEEFIVLMIDEVDNASNNELFLDFLGMLRNKYLKRSEGKGHTFYSIILAGVHDIKSLKGKIRANDEQQFNSPWNIAAEFDIDIGFNVTEITSLLVAYSQKSGVGIDIPGIAEKIYYYTSGYPFLVSYICKLLDEKILPEKNENRWTLKDIETAVTHLLKSSNTNFDSLIKNLENNLDLYAFIKSIAIEGDSISYHVTDNLISLAKTYGMIKEEKGNCKIHNKIYEQLIYDHMMVKLMRERKANKVSRYNISSHFTQSDGSLDFEKVLLKFQEFMTEQYSQKDRDFLERNGRLVFQAFLKPIINGTGFDFKEAQISEERRMDIVVTWGNHKYVVELKIWRGPKAHDMGLLQLADYLERTHLQKGYLIIFDSRLPNKEYIAQQIINIEGKEIFMIRV
jgi:AAA-like domain/PD-(D/E)XK nuclease superfamily